MQLFFIIKRVYIFNLTKSMTGIDEQSDLMVSTLKSLKCIICNNILSVPPVLTITSEEHQCGRCKNIKHRDGAIRNTIFESVAQHLTFPCMNSNCTEMLHWKDVENHEEDCINTTITCPIFHDNCEEKIALKDIMSHMVKKHGNNIYFENIELRVAMFKSFVCVGVVENEEFLIYICNDKVLVTSIKPNTQELTYSLKLSSDKKNPILLYENQEVEKFSERKHCFRCLDKRCDLKQHPYSTHYQPKPIDNLLLRRQNNQKKSKHNLQPNLGGVLSGDPFSSPFATPTTTSSTSSLFADCTLKNSYTFNTPRNNVQTSSTSDSGVNVSATPTSNPSTFEKDPAPKTSNNSSNEIKALFQNCESDKTDKTISQLNEIKCTSFNLTHVQNLLGFNPCFVFTITISANEEFEHQQMTESFIPRSLLSTIDNTDILRRILECPICNEFMTDKINVCERGHQICGKCKALNASRGTCPSCMGALADGRSIALEALAEECSICCCYRETGCEFRGNIKTVYKHEKNCDKSI